jgi:cyclophilin family peptidyl-prolyl cis-trans isomerase
VLTDAELMKVYQYKFAEDKPAIRFSTVARTPRPEPYFVSMDLVAHFGEEGEDTEAEEINFGRIRLEVRCDVAPLASRVFLLLCNDDQKFTVTFGDVEFCRHSGEEDGGANDTFSTENRLLANLPGMMSFVLKPGESEPRTKELQICHPDKKANRHGLNGAVFAKVVCGMESLKYVDSFRDAMWDREKKHPFNDAMPAVYFYFDNVTVDAEFCGVEEL